MDEKLPPDLFSLSEKDPGKKPEEDINRTTQPPGFGLGFSGRLGGNADSSVDLASALPDEDEAVAEVAKRFRRGGLGIASSAVSLDAQVPEEKIEDNALESFVLDALDTPIEEEHESEGVHSGIICPSCHAPNPSNMRFCVQCGGALAPSAAKPKVSAPSARITLTPRKQPPPPTEASRQANPWEIYLISINEDGSDGTAIALEFLETTIGREGDTRFPTDAFLSPKHARLHIEKGDLFIEDLYSLNGTFLKLRDEVKLTPGDTFLMGRQVLRFERFEQSISPKTKSSDGTRYMGSPAPGGNFKILQIGIGGVVQNVYCLPEAGAVLGREKGDIIFPHDKFMSSRHAQIYNGDDSNCYLVDLTSSNGTWIKIWEKTQLRHGDFIFMGQQLFRVHIKDQKKKS